jgi:hypothetical protein
MEPDYPAAHSMDASWYAVDKNGHVALFNTGAGGAIPSAAYSPEGAALFENCSPEELEEMGVADELRETLDPQRLPDQSRLFVYQTGELDECLAAPYERSRPPKKPLHVDELDPELRRLFGSMQFPDVDFRKAEVLQPCELTECSTWDPAYLTSDGKAVRPVPGREGEYKQFAEQLRAEFGSEGPTVEGVE